MAETPRPELTLFEQLKQWARQLKYDVIALYFSLKHPRTPLYAKIVTAVIVGYALSPIDLIPDFVPILGYVDEVILLPVLISVAIKLIPADVLNACREEAIKNPPAMKPKIWVAAYVIIIIWTILLFGLYRWIL